VTGLPQTPAHPPVAHSGPPSTAAGQQLTNPHTRGDPPTRTCGGSRPTRIGHRRNAMIGRLIKAAIIAIVLAAIIQSIPDIKRYLEIRKM
jgi:hypothetical protein